jgi:DNA polymerase III psi subunit
MGIHTRSDPADTQARTLPEVQTSRGPQVDKKVLLETRQSDDQIIKAEEIPVCENVSASTSASTSASACTSPSPTGTVLPSKFTALVYAHAHVTLVAVGAQLQAQHWALSKNISLACHAANSVQSDTSALPSVLEFHWPIPGVPANEPEAAESAFAGFLSKHTAQSDTRVLLLGDLSQQLAQVFVQHAADKQILIGPSLDAMMTDQSLKRSLWQDLIANGFA